jgi:hypothetical protein
VCEGVGVRKVAENFAVAAAAVTEKIAAAGLGKKSRGKIAAAALRSIFL